MDNISVFKDRLQQERKNSKLTLEQLGERVNISRQTLSLWERGMTSPTVHDLLKLCKVFHCDFGYLVGEYDCRTRETTDIVTATGLSEQAVNCLLSFKNTSSQDKWSQVTNGRSAEMLKFFSSFIANNEVWQSLYPIMNDYEAFLHQNSINEKYRLLFDNEVDGAAAVDYFRFHLQQTILRFIDSYFGKNQASGGGGKNGTNR